MKTKKMRRADWVAIFLALAVFLTACSGLQSDDPPENTVVPNIDDQPGSDGTQTDEVVQPSHISRELTEGVTVDADVTYPEQKEYETFATKYADYDVELLKELFLENDPSTSTVDNSKGITITTENGSYISSRYGRLLYTAPEDKKYTTIGDLLWLYAQNDAYFNEVELSFMSRENAEYKILSILDKLDIIGKPEVSAFVGLDHSTIETYQQQLKEDEDYTEIMDWGKIEDLNGLTEADDAYFIRITFKRSDLPFFDRTMEQGVEFAGESTDVPSAYAQALITANGLKSLTVIGCYSLREAQINTSEVIDIEDLLTKVRDKYDLQIVTAPITFTRIYMEYIPLRQTTESVKIMPYWTLEYGLTMEDGTFKVVGAQRYNAITGEDMAYGG